MGIFEIYNTDLVKALSQCYKWFSWCFNERRFSIDKESMVENQKEESLVSSRYVYDAFQSLVSVQNVTIDNKMKDAARNSYSKYKESYRKEEVIGRNRKNFRSGP